MRKWILFYPHYPQALLLLRIHKSNNTMKTPNYLDGMIRSEAIHFVKNLPGLTEQEFNDLMAQAEVKPVTRKVFVNPKGSLEKRIQSVLAYLREHPGSTRKQIAADLKYNGANLYYSLNEAVNRGLIDRVVLTKRRIVYKVRSSL